MKEAFDTWWKDPQREQVNATVSDICIAFESGYRAALEAAAQKVEQFPDFEALTETMAAAVRALEEEQ